MKNKIIIASKYAVKIVVFLVLMVLLNKGIAYLVVDDSTLPGRYMMQEFYEAEDVDVLFWGSSHSFVSIDPSILLELSGENSFNAGSNSQHIDASFTLLKEYTKNNTLERVYLECYYNAMDRTSFVERTAGWVSSAYNISDQMPFSSNKIAFLFDASSPEYYINSFVPAKRYWKNLFLISELTEIYQAKQTEDYQNFVYKTDTEKYAGNGFLAIYKQLEEYVEVESIDFSMYVPSDDWLTTFYEIHEYCEANGIELILYSTAMPVETLASGDYDIYINQMYSIIENTDLTYIDFNLAKKELLVTEPSDFKDNNHLHYYGALKQTEAFYQVFYELENPEDYFYDTFYEKLVDLYPEYLEETDT